MKGKMDQNKRPEEAAVTALLNTVREVLITEQEFPVLCIWIISAEMAKTIQTATIEQLTLNPSLIVELDYPAEGGLVIKIMAARCDDAHIEDIIKQLANYGNVKVMTLL